MNTTQHVHRSLPVYMPDAGLAVEHHRLARLGVAQQPVAELCSNASISNVYKKHQIDGNLCQHHAVPWRDLPVLREAHQLKLQNARGQVLHLRPRQQKPHRQWQALPRHCPDHRIHASQFAYFSTSKVHAPRPSGSTVRSDQAVPATVSGGRDPPKSARGASLSSLS